MKWVALKMTYDRAFICELARLCDDVAGYEYISDSAWLDTVLAQLEAWTQHTCTPSACAVCGVWRVARGM